MPTPTKRGTPLCLILFAAATILIRPAEASAASLGLELFGSTAPIDLDETTGFRVIPRWSATAQEAEGGLRLLLFATMGNLKTGGVFASSQRGSAGANHVPLTYGGGGSYDFGLASAAPGISTLEVDLVRDQDGSFVASQKVSVTFDGKLLVWGVKLRAEPIEGAPGATFVTSNLVAGGHFALTESGSTGPEEDANGDGTLVDDYLPPFADEQTRFTVIRQDSYSTDHRGQVMMLLLQVTASDMPGCAPGEMGTLQLREGRSPKGRPLGHDEIEIVVCGIARRYVTSPRHHDKVDVRFRQCTPKRTCPMLLAKFPF